MNASIPEALHPWLAEIALAGGGLSLLLLATVKPLRRHLGDLALLAIALSAIGAVVSMEAPSGIHLRGLIVADPFAGFFRLVLSMVAMTVVWLATRARDDAQPASPWSWVFFVVGLLGMDLAVVAVHAVPLWAGLEVSGLCGAAWFASGAEGRGLSSAALLQGHVASALLLLGFVLLFGLTGTLSFAGLGDRLSLSLAAPGGRSVMFAGIVFVIAGALSRAFLVAWHSARAGAKDDGAAAETAWATVGSTVVAIAVLARFLRSVATASINDGNWTILAGVEWPDLLSVVAMVTMTLGNLAALRASTGRRALESLAVAQGGYLLLGLVVCRDGGLEAMLFHVVAFALTVLGAVAALAPVVEPAGTADLDVLRGLARRGGPSRVIAAAITLFFLSLAGVPPLAGYAGKVYLLSAVFGAGRPLLALVVVFNSLLGLLCAARVVATLLDKSADEQRELVVDFEALLLLALLAAGTIAVGAWPAALESFVNRSVVFFGG